MRRKIHEIKYLHAVAMQASVFNTENVVANGWSIPYTYIYEIIQIALGIQAPNVNSTEKDLQCVNMPRTFADEYILARVLWLEFCIGMLCVYAQK